MPTSNLTGTIVSREFVDRTTPLRRGTIWSLRSFHPLSNESAREESRPASSVWSVDVNASMALGHHWTGGVRLASV